MTTVMCVQNCVHAESGAGIGRGLAWTAAALFNMFCFTFALQQVLAATGGSPMPGNHIALDDDTYMPLWVQAQCKGVPIFGVVLAARRMCLK